MKNFINKYSVPFAIICLAIAALVSPVSSLMENCAGKKKNIEFEQSDKSLFEPSENQRFVFYGKNGKTLTLELGNIMTVTGDLEYDEAAKLLLKYVGMYYCKGDPNEKTKQP